MNKRLRLLYLIVLMTFSSGTIKTIILNDYKWYFKVLELIFIIAYLLALSKLLIKTTNYYSTIPKDSDIIHLQTWGKYYIAMILFICIGLYAISINTPEVDFFYILPCLLIADNDEIYQVAYELDGKKYYYFEKQNESKEIKSYKKYDNFVDLFFSDDEHLLISTRFKTKKNKQLISEFFV